jgi:hypothetical protein
MWFHICAANHNETGRSSLVDQMDWVTAGLIDAGHEVTFSENSIEPSAINLFWECFCPGVGRKIIESGVTYGIVATEIPDGEGFNWRDELHWHTRYRSFFEAAEGASFIWALVESAVPFYSQFGPSAYLELGFSKRLVPSYIDHKPSIDFSFFGQMTPYRENIIDRMKRYASIYVPDTFLPHCDVHKLIAESKIGLNFKQSGLWPVPSGPRLGRLMLAKRGVASEYLPVPTRQGEIAGLCPQDRDFVDYAIGMVKSDWRAHAEAVFDAYAARMPMGAIMENILDSTVSGLSTSPSCRKEASIYFTCDTDIPSSNADVRSSGREHKLRILLKPAAELLLTSGRALNAQFLSNAGKRLWCYATSANGA